MDYLISSCTLLKQKRTEFPYKLFVYTHLKFVAYFKYFGFILVMLYLVTKFHTIFIARC